jgi:hypothetical protein
LSAIDKFTQSESQSGLSDGVNSAAYRECASIPGAMVWIIATEPGESMFGRLCGVMPSIYDAAHKLQTNK